LLLRLKKENILKKAGVLEIVKEKRWSR